jgi:hypothetical protein
MRVNRSVPRCTVIPVLIYPDPGAAADWLSWAFGFNLCGQHWDFTETIADIAPEDWSGGAFRLE